MLKYPVGGPRQPVYDLMRSLGFSMEKFGDKHWKSADGIHVHIYLTGSMARIYRGDTLHGECQLDDLAARLDTLRLEVA